MKYVDESLLLVAWLEAKFPGVRSCTELPAVLLGALPVYQVTRVTGGEVAPTLDAPVVDVDTYAADQVTAKDLAEQARASLTFDLPGWSHIGGTVAKVTTISGPASRPTADRNLRRYGASYRIVIHTH